MAEGWAIFNGPRRAEIQKAEGAASFRSNEDAVSFVVERALKGSTFHAKAVAIHFGTLARS